MGDSSTGRCQKFIVLSKKALPVLYVTGEVAIEIFTASLEPSIMGFGFNWLINIPCGLFCGD